MEKEDSSQDWSVCFVTQALPSTHSPLDFGEVNDSLCFGLLVCKQGRSHPPRTAAAYTQNRQRHAGHGRALVR